MFESNFDILLIFSIHTYFNDIDGIFYLKWTILNDKSKNYLSFFYNDTFKYNLKDMTPIGIGIMSNDFLYNFR